MSPLWPVVCCARRVATGSFLAAFGCYSEVARSDGAQLVAQGQCALAAERCLELLPSLAPQPPRNTKPLGACPGQVQLLAAAIQDAVLYAYEAVTLQRQHRPSQRRSIHDQLAGERVDRQRSQAFQLRQNRALRRTPPGRGEALVV